MSRSDSLSRCDLVVAGLLLLLLLLHAMVVGCVAFVDFGAGLQKKDKRFFCFLIGCLAESPFVVASSFIDLPFFVVLVPGVTFLFRGAAFDFLGVLEDVVSFIVIPSSMSALDGGVASSLPVLAVSTIKVGMLGERYSE